MYSKCKCSLNKLPFRSGRSSQHGLLTVTHCVEYGPACQRVIFHLVPVFWRSNPETVQLTRNVPPQPEQEKKKKKQPVTNGERNHLKLSPWSIIQQWPHASAHNLLLGLIKCSFVHCGQTVVKCHLVNISTYRETVGLLVKASARHLGMSLVWRFSMYLPEVLSIVCQNTACVASCTKQTSLPCWTRNFSHLGWQHHAWQQPPVD